MTTALIWFRNDLRLADQLALHAALDAGLTPVPLYIHDPAPVWPDGAAARWWLHHSLTALTQALRERGSDLVVMRGDTARCLRECAAACGATHLFWQRRYEPALIERDRALKNALQDGLDVQSLPGNLLREPWQVTKADRTPYRVFTPFWNALRKNPPADAPLPPPDTLPEPCGHKLKSLSVDALGLLPGRAWADAFQAHWIPGETGARARLNDFTAEALADYAELRDRPDLPGTSRLSPHLHFGEISPRQVWFGLHERLQSPEPGRPTGAIESYLRELAWREFAHHLLFHFPRTTDAPLDRRFEQFPWEHADRATLNRWRKGNTGIPIVDAGMRELWATGWMHNRVRMIVASLLTKNLLISWQEGARWFWDTLVDADLANNTLGWQWAAGCGADAAPYFRIFNPVAQGQRFDPDGAYVRRWVPELRNLPAKWIHQPWTAPDSSLSTAGLKLGTTYPYPMLDLAQTRQRALAAWDRIKRLRVG